MSLSSSPSGVWFKSTYSGTYDAQCVEVCAIEHGVAVRDSKHPNGPQLHISEQQWQNFLGSAITS
ncbi:DUF397 domain-containing protein [Streptomyces sp. NPDC005438]|uniref:DUF397 domain-containing protein n=1 Tax=Streptomyces sp. NPDC005438 TaxID=3156880 RepID=UPI0033AD880A